LRVSFTCALIVLGAVLGGCARTPEAQVTQTAEADLAAECGKPDAPAQVMVPGGEFEMGSNAAYPEEAPVRRVALAPFAIDTFEVSNAQFARFVEATNYITTAEREPDPSFVPQGAPAEYSEPGAAVFFRPDAANPSWWRFTTGAFWRKPSGPGSSINGLDDHPVVQVSFEDASAYAAWAGRRLPTEEEWEYAARGKVKGTRYSWGDDPPDSDVRRANIWQGLFPLVNSGEDGFTATAPIGCFDPNSLGLYDMIGNVWEWTDTPYQGGVSATGEPIRVIKGGSFLCHANYCERYRPAARQGQEIGLPTNHIGFRTATSDVDGIQ
jgi:formylglycine-generating enzyme